MDEIKATEISREWLMKQRVSEKGKRILYEFMYTGSALREQERPSSNLEKELGRKIVEFIYQIPEYEQYRGITEGFLTSSVSSRVTNYIQLSARNFDPLYEFTKDEYGADTYVNSETGQSWGGLRIIPKQLMVGDNYRFANIPTTIAIDLTPYLTRKMTVPKEWRDGIAEWSKTYGNNKNQVGEEITNKFFLSKLTEGQRIELKELYIKLLDAKWEFENLPLKYNYGKSKPSRYYGRGYLSFLTDISTMAELDCEFPELVDKYVEAILADLGPRYLRSLKGKDKDAFLSIRMKSEITNLKNILGYFNSPDD